jgi:sulfur-oxidizing protein SoxB
MKCAVDSNYSPRFFATTWLRLHGKGVLQIMYFACALIATSSWAEVSRDDVAPPQNKSASTKITFIHFNDLHAHLTPHADLVPDAPYGQTSTKTKVVERGGIARLATVVKRIRADNPNSIFMNIGDTYHGGVEAFFTNGNAIVDPVNALNIDVGVVGNWDYAYGPLVTRMRYSNLPITKMMRPMQRIVGKMRRSGSRQSLDNNEDIGETKGESEMMMPFGEIKRPNFPNLAANLTLTMPPMRRGQLMMPATMVKEMNGVKVGLIGLTSDIVPRMHKVLAMGMSFVEGEDNYRTLVNRYQKKLRAEGADVVVVMSELGIQKNYRLAQIIDPGVDVIFSAHTHEAIYKPLTSQSGALVVEAGNDGNVGRMDVIVRGGKVVDHQWQLSPIDNTIPEDPEVKALVDKARAPFLAANVNMSVPMPMMHQKLTQPINTVVGHTNVLLDRRQVLESSFNDLMGNIMRRTSGTDVAITPGFRFDSVVPGRGTPVQASMTRPSFSSHEHGIVEGRDLPVEDNTVATGDITLEDVYRFFPVPYTIATAKISGEQLRQVMEQALTNVFSTDVFLQSGGWLEGFAGLDTTLNLANQDGHRISSMRLTGSGNPVKSGDVVSVTGCTRLMDAKGSLCSYHGFTDVQPLINKATGQAWTPVDIFVAGISSDVQSRDTQPRMRDTNATPFWPRAPFIQPLKGGK